MNYAEKFDAIAKECLEEIDTIDRLLEHAEAESKKYPKSTNGFTIDSQWLADRAQAEANYAKAKDVRAKSDRALSEYDARLASLRSQYIEELHERYDSRSKDIDSNLMTLLQSGTMNTADYIRAMDDMLGKANYTMARIVAKHAAEAAEATNDTPQGQHDAQMLRAIALKGSEDRVAGKLEVFDGLVSIFETCKRNRRMKDSWNELTGRMLDLL